MDPTPSIEKGVCGQTPIPPPRFKEIGGAGGKQTMGLKFIHCFSDPNQNSSYLASAKVAHNWRRNTKLAPP